MADLSVVIVICQKKISVELSIVKNRDFVIVIVVLLGHIYIDYV